MAQDFLSQEEVDALLKGVAGETDEVVAEAGDVGGVKPYDLGRQERIVRGRMPTMELINERFARYLRIGLFNYMHKGVEVSVAPIKVQKYSEFIRNLVVPTNLNLVQAKPLRGTGTDRARPEPGFPRGRQHVRRRRALPHPGRGPRLHPTEQRIIQACSASSLRNTRSAWQPVYPYSSNTSARK
jgi:flagellar motor switch protein FliM